MPKPIIKPTNLAALSENDFKAADILLCRRYIFNDDQVFEKRRNGPIVFRRAVWVGVTILVGIGS